MHGICATSLRYKIKSHGLVPTVPAHKKRLSKASQRYKLYSYIPSTISCMKLLESKKACNKVVLYATTTYRLIEADHSQSFEIVSDSGIIL